MAALCFTNGQFREVAFLKTHHRALLVEEPAGTTVEGCKLVKMEGGADLEVSPAAEEVDRSDDEPRTARGLPPRPPLPPGAKPAYVHQAEAKVRRVHRWDDITLGLQRARQRGEGFNAALTSRPSRKLRRELSPLVPR